MKRFHSIKRLNSELMRLENSIIVFTNGVFDLIHPGHIELLQYAKGLGDILIVGVNDDESVIRLKGDNRPIIPIAERMEILEAIEFVDYIIPFPEDTPLELIKKIGRIDIMVKGGDYKPHEVVGKDYVEQNGGKVSIFEFKSNYSTSAIIKKIRQEF